MYESHFRLRRRPFSPAVDTGSYVGVGTLEEARQTLVRAISRGSGPAMVIGGAGTGKTMLCQVIAEQFSPQIRVAMLANGRLGSPRALYQAILFELGLPYREMDENELRLSLVDFLSDLQRCPNGMLLIIDEAHAVPLRLLEEVRMLTNVTQGGQSQVRLLMAGGPTLEERFASPKLESFNQRIASRCYLESFNREQTTSFIQEQLATAGSPHQEIFNPEAVAAVYDATDGIPRLVNQLCDHAMVMAAVGGHPAVSAAIVQEAWADLQQLPTPWVEPSSSAGPIATEAAVVEFGALSDDPAAPTSIPFPHNDDPAAGLPQAADAGQTAAQELDPDQQLAELQRQVASLSEDEVEDVAPPPTAEVQPQQSAAPAAAANPFDEAFDEEEVVVDGYASLQESFFADAPRVKSEEGRQIAALLAQTAEEAQEERDEISVENHGPQSDGLAESPVHVDYTEGQRRQKDLTDAVAAILPQHDSTAAEDESEYDEMAGEEPASIQMPLAARTDEPAYHQPADDRDLIIVQEQQDEEQASPPPTEKHAAKRQKYRQLFARLRQA